MPSTFQPPPTYAEVVLYDKKADSTEAFLRSAKFNPIWLKWFIDLVKGLGTGGGGSGTVTSVGSGTGLSGGPITTSGSLAISNTTVTPASYGDATHVATFTVNGQGQLTAAASVAITAGNLTGPVTSVGLATSVTANAITNAMLAQMATLTIKGNVTGGTANAVDLTVAQVLALLGTPVQTGPAAWTPADASGAALAFTSVSANYTRIGNMVFAYATWAYPATIDATAASISGLPVAVANANYAEVPSIVATTVTITGGLVLKAVKNTATAKFDVGTPFGAVTNAQLSGATVTVLLTYPAT